MGDKNKDVGNGVIKMKYKRNLKFSQERARKGLKKGKWERNSYLFKSEKAAKIKYYRRDKGVMQWENEVR